MYYLSYEYHNLDPRLLQVQKGNLGHGYIIFGLQPVSQSAEVPDLQEFAFIQPVSLHPTTEGGPGLPDL